MVDATFGAGPPNSNISQNQISGQYISGVFVSQFPSGTPISGTALGSGQAQIQTLSGVYTCNVPTRESSWNV